MERIGSWQKLGIQMDKRMGICIITSRETDHERLTAWQRLQSAKRKKRKSLIVHANEISIVESALTLADFTGLELIIPSLRGQDATAAIQEL